MKTRIITLDFADVSFDDLVDAMHKGTDDLDVCVVVNNAGLSHLRLPCSLSLSCVSFSPSCFRPTRGWPRRGKIGADDSLSLCFAVPGVAHEVALMETFHGDERLPGEVQGLLRVNVQSFTAVLTYAIAAVGILPASLPL